MIGSEWWKTSLIILAWLVISGGNLTIKKCIQIKPYSISLIKNNLETLSYSSLMKLIFYDKCSSIRFCFNMCYFTIWRMPLQWYSNSNVFILITLAGWNNRFHAMFVPNRRQWRVCRDICSVFVILLTVLWYLTAKLLLISYVLFIHFGSYLIFYNVKVHAIFEEVFFSLLIGDFTSPMQMVRVPQVFVLIFRRFCLFLFVCFYQTLM